MSDFEYNSCIPDLLHLFLRISDKLIELLVEQANIKDNLSVQDKKNQTNFIKLTNFFESNFNVTRLIRKVDGNYVLRNLNGKDKRAIFKGLSEKDEDFFTLNLPEYTEQKIGKIQRLWTDFYFILTDIKESMVDYINIKDRTEIWLHLFLEVIIF